MASGLGKQSHTSLGRALTLESDSPEHTAEWFRGIKKSLFVWNGAVGAEWETSVSRCSERYREGFRADPREPHLLLKVALGSLLLFIFGAALP